MPSDSPGAPGSVRRAARLACLWVLAAMLAGCGMFGSRKPAPVVTPAQQSQQPPRFTEDGEPLSPYGNPDFYIVDGKVYHVLKSAEGFEERGIASWYGPDFHGKRTSSGEPYDMYQMTAAHKLLPLPTVVEVTNLANGRKAVLRVNDRGPFKDNRILDLSYAAALKLDIVGPGTAFVTVKALSRQRIGPQTVPPGELAAAVPPATLAVVPPRPAPPVQRMYLQIGAFSDRGNAERLQGRVAPQLNDNVRVFEDTAMGKRLFKVQVGPIDDVDHADRIASALDRIGLVDHHFVSN